MVVVREPGQRGDAVHGRVEDQLRPARGLQVGHWLHLQPRLGDQRRCALGEGERSVVIGRQPGRRVEHVLDVVVGELRPAHEGDRRELRPGAVLPDRLLGAQAVLNGHDRAVAEAVLQL